MHREPDLGRGAKDSGQQQHGITISDAGRGAYRLVAKVYTWFGFERMPWPYVVEEGGKRVISPHRVRADGER